MAESLQAIIALGSNLGNRREHLTGALQLLQEAPGIQKVTSSPVYETAPVGVEDQPPFLNMVAGVKTTLTPEALMELLLETEQQMGRVRDLRWGPRTIDLDLLFFEQEERQAPGLTLPHPRWAERSFVTIPLRDLLSHPDFRSARWDSLRERLRDLPPDDEVRRSD
jgi:2-amino-4-hydroxy-6-hydroxymethyldihydropteridine diphosphokinase